MKEHELAEASRRAAAWLVNDTGAVVTRERAINEEELALDVLALVARVRQLEQAIRVWRGSFLVRVGELDDEDETLARILDDKGSTR